MTDSGSRIAGAAGKGRRGYLAQRRRKRKKVRSNGGGRSAAAAKQSLAEAGRGGSMQRK
jgi:hypothetical protein